MLVFSSLNYFSPCVSDCSASFVEIACVRVTCTCCLMLAGRAGRPKAPAIRRTHSGALQWRSSSNILLWLLLFRLQFTMFLQTTGDLSSHLLAFISTEEMYETRTVRVLKAANQSMLAASVVRLKMYVSSVCSDCRYCVHSFLNSDGLFVGYHPWVYL